jgi:hypothetical protein
MCGELEEFQLKPLVDFALNFPKGTNVNVFYDDHNQIIACCCFTSIFAPPYDQTC